jgi:hypothetical protein
MTTTASPAVILVCSAKHTTRIPAAAVDAHWARHGYSKCACGRPARQNWVHGKTNAAVRCDARCTNARRGDCECSCGGENHGSDHQAIPA